MTHQTTGGRWPTCVRRSMRAGSRAGTRAGPLGRRGVGLGCPGGSRSLGRSSDGREPRSDQSVCVTRCELDIAWATDVVDVDRSFRAVARDGRGGCRAESGDVVPVNEPVETGRVDVGIVAGERDAKDVGLGDTRAETVISSNKSSRVALGRRRREGTNSMSCEPSRRLWFLW